MHGKLAYIHLRTNFARHGHVYRTGIASIIGCHITELLCLWGGIFTVIYLNLCTEFHKRIPLAWGPRVVLINRYSPQESRLQPFFFLQLYQFLAALKGNYLWNGELLFTLHSHLKPNYQISFDKRWLECCK